MLSNQETNDLLIDEPPNYDSVSVVDTPELIDQEVNACLQEENEYLIREIELLRQDNKQLKQSQSVLEQQIILIREQLRLTKESKQLSDARAALLQQNNKLLRSKNSALIDWVKQSAADEKQALLYIDVLESCALAIAERTN
ncbi:hypothetical protein [Legionella maioricensis]|uniref:Uncharacterized protein n=1 Tax=Legionella maioricensis TaxID=2896528 RepID=A0A9X2CYX0_9GAMM|nr:hypothetical protein [Legionella maioricensis]MCL9683234.1 hypothetical protein [Legionella maioricensis]MCL9686068.1 hypothetical protein [Legionella maioricensis]